MTCVIVMLCKSALIWRMSFPTINSHVYNVFVLRVSIFSSSAFLIFDLGIVPKVWYFCFSCYNLQMFYLYGTVSPNAEFNIPIFLLVCISIYCFDGFTNYNCIL